MIVATLKSTGQKVYYFESKSQPGHYHKVTHNAQHGAFECNCLGFTGKYHKCWHVAQVAKLATVALKAQRQPVVQQPVAAQEAPAAVAEAFYAACAEQDAKAAQWHEANVRAMAEERATSQAKATSYDVIADALAVVNAAMETKPSQEDQWEIYQLARMGGWDGTYEPTHRCQTCGAEAHRQFLTEGWQCEEHAALIAKPARDKEDW